MPASKSPIQRKSAPTGRREKAGEKKPVFDAARCKRCGICTHFCPFGAIAQREDGTPYLAKPEACTSCRLCEEMCPDWAIRLAAASAGEAGKGSAKETASGPRGDRSGSRGNGRGAAAEQED